MPIGSMPTNSPASRPSCGAEHFDAHDLDGVVRVGGTQRRAADLARSQMMTRLTAHRTKPLSLTLLAIGNLRHVVIVVMVQTRLPPTLRQEQMLDACRTIVDEEGFTQSRSTVLRRIARSVGRSCTSSSEV